MSASERLCVKWSEVWMRRGMWWRHNTLNSNGGFRRSLLGAEWQGRAQHAPGEVTNTSSAARVTHSVWWTGNGCCLLSAGRPISIWRRQRFFLGLMENKTCFCHSAFRLILRAHTVSVSSLLRFHSLILFVSFLLSDAARCGWPSKSSTAALVVAIYKDFKRMLFA